MSWKSEYGNRAKEELSEVFRLSSETKEHELHFLHQKTALNFEIVNWDAIYLFELCELENNKCFKRLPIPKFP